MSIIINEIRQAWRGLLRQPGFLLLATATLALGIAALLASPRFFDMIWGRHRETPVRQE